MINATLSLQSVSQSFLCNNIPTAIFNNITIDFVQGNSYAITGLSGTGKSTLLHLIAGLDKPTKGSVLFNSVPLESFSQQERSSFLNTSIGLVFQSSHMIKELSVIENVMLTRLIAGKSKKNAYETALVLLERVGLVHAKDMRTGELSGGQQQRIALARALMNEPAFLIADEPTGNLDTETGTSIIALIREYHVTKNMGIIITSHDTMITQQMNEIFELKNGNLIQQTQSRIHPWYQQNEL